MYRADDENRFLEVTYQNGDKEILFYRDFASGAMIENIVRRAKKGAIKRAIAKEGDGDPHERPARVDPPGVQGERGPPEHDQPGRLGHGSRARRGSESSTCAPCSRTPRTPRDVAEGRSSGWVPASTCSRLADQGACARPGADVAGRRAIARLPPPGDRVGLVAVPKVCGIETEYGVQHVGGDQNPVASSSMLVNAYVSDLAQAGWDFEDEAPGNDARGFAREGSMPPEIETHLVNAVLTNGARYYVDHAHPEMSTPECADPLEAVLYDKAGEIVLRRSMAAAKRMLPEGQSIVVYKNNSDRKGNSYGTHENYLMDRVGPVRADRSPRHPALRHAPDLHRRRQGRNRDADPRRSRGSLPVVAALRVLRGGDRARDHAQASDREHA